MKIIIIGNSGSGKSYTGQKLSCIKQLPCTHLDKIFFRPGGFTVSDERPIEDVYKDLDKVRLSDQWIIEGIFGDLIERCSPNATHFLFLDLSQDQCEKGLRLREFQPENWNDPEIGRSVFEDLINWAINYWNRNDRFSHEYHLRLYDSFVGIKCRLQTITELDDWLKQWQ